MKSVQKKIGVSRRGFLAAGAGFGLFNLVPASVLGADAPSNKVTMGLIGAGGQGMSNMRSFLGLPDVRFLAVCDVNRKKREKGKSEVDGRYGNKDCATYLDFRELCLRDDIDAVLTGTRRSACSPRTVARTSSARSRSRTISAKGAPSCARWSATAACGRRAAGSVRAARCAAPWSS